MNDYAFKGPFAKHIQNHISLKKAIGYKYVTESNHLLRFSYFTEEKYPDAKVLTKEIVIDWCSKKIYETQANQSSRASIMRQLAVSMDNVGICSYILPKKIYLSGKKYLPYIYTDHELKVFFEQTDLCHYVSGCPYRHHIMPVFFRMIYSCGLRSSEARLLKISDVNLDEGILTIKYSKNDNSRFVPMSPELTRRCNNYFSIVHVFSNDNDWFFPGLNGKPMTISNVYNNFRRFLWKAGISHGGRGKGPRVHDFRHVYACNCLKKWVLQGKDLGVYLPILKTYMGHDSFNETAYYLKLTADIFPDIIIKMEGIFSDIIPRLEGDFNETY